MFDTVIQNVKVIDGSGQDAFVADVAILDGTIQVVGKVDDTAKAVIDGTGKTLTPGFVDSHSHADWNVLAYPQNSVALAQGVTTQITGQCGQSPTPISDEYAYWGLWPDIHAFYGAEKERFENLGDLHRFLREKYGIDEHFDTTEAFFKLWKKRGVAFNMLPLTGHNNIRAIVMGQDVARPATQDEIGQMCDMLRVELEAGYHGMSTGLDYYPGRYSQPDELLALARVLKEHDAIYTSHVRIVQQGWDGYPFKGELCGIQEAIRIGRETGVKVHISHVLPYGYHVTEDFEARKALDAKVIRKMLEEALSEGIDITCDVMPGENGASYERDYMIALLLPWIKEAGGLEPFRSVLASDDFLTRLRDDVNSFKNTTLSMIWEPTLDDWLLVTHCSDTRYVGKTIREISRMMGSDHLEAICTVLRADYHTRIYWRMGSVSPAFLKEMLAFPRAFPSCDSHSCEVGQIFGDDKMLDPGPSWLTYNFAVRFIKEFGVLRLEDTIHRMTAFPLSQHGVTDRGQIRVGMAADLVLLDENKLDVNQDIFGEKRSPLGIEKVFVNGVCAFEHGAVTGSKSGALLTR